MGSVQVLSAPPSLFEIGLCYSKLSVHAWHSQPGTAKLQQGMFYCLFTTARLINSCLHACLPGEKLSPLWQVARCQKCRAHCWSHFSPRLPVPSPLQPPQCLWVPRGWHSLVSRGRGLGWVEDFPAELLMGGGESLYSPAVC